MSKLGILNYYFLQWLFIRLAKTIDNGIFKEWCILYWVVPLTGWDGIEYKYLKGKKRNKRLLLTKLGKRI
jgi:hypothetical protein